MDRCAVLDRSGALGEIRTPDPRNRNPMLYPAELRARGAPDIRDAGPLLSGKSEAGMAAAVLPSVGGRALVAPIGRWAVVIGEAAGLIAGTVIVEIADT